MTLKWLSIPLLHLAGNADAMPDGRHGKGKLIVGEKHDVNYLQLALGTLFFFWRKGVYRAFYSYLNVARHRKT